MPDAKSSRPSRTRAIWSVAAAVVVSVGAALSAGVAQGRVATLTAGPIATQMSADTDAKATGGGTVTAPVDVVASFGLNAKRLPGFTPGTGGPAKGRINYDKHVNLTGRHVNVPVVFMEAETTNTPPNGTGGKATLVGDCAGPGAECPPAPNNGSVIVYVEDNGDSGDLDIFRIFFCSLGPSLPPPSFNGTTPPTGCQPFEGGTLRTGNIQIRPSNGSGGSGQAPTAARAPIRLP